MTSYKLKTVSRLTLLLLIAMLGNAPGCHGNTDKSCFPVKEGDSCTLTCEGKTSTTYRWIIWRAFNNNDKNTKVFKSSCYEETHSGNVCYMEEAKSLKRYQATIKHNDLNFTSWLTIHTVTRSEINVTFQCVIKDMAPTNARNVRIREWNLTSVYFPPEAVTCQAEKETSTVSSFNVMCSTAKVYPGMTCHLKKIHYVNGLTLNSTYYDVVKSDSSQQVSENTDYFTSTCVVAVSIYRPGNLALTMEIYPAVKPEYHKLIFPVNWEESINVLPKSSVQVDVRSNQLCPQNVYSSQVLCIASFVPSEARIEWYLNNITANRDDFQETISYDSFGTVTSNITLKSQFLVKTAEQGLLATCKVFYKEQLSSAEVEKHDSKRLFFKWPPQEKPKFERQTGSALASSELITSDSMTLSCVVQGGSPQVSSVQVTCSGSGHSQPFLHKKSSGTSVSFLLSQVNTRGDIYCNCFAEHETDCSPLNQTLHLRHPEPAKYESVTEELTEKKYTILYIVIGACVFVMLVIFFGIFICFRSKCKALYTYTNGSYRSDNAQSTVCPIYEDIHTPPPTPQLNAVYNNGRAEVPLNRNMSDDAAVVLDEERVHFLQRQISSDNSTASSRGFSLATRRLRTSDASSFDSTWDESDDGIPYTNGTVENVYIQPMDVIMYSDDRENGLFLTSPNSGQNTIDSPLEISAYR